LLNVKRLNTDLIELNGALGSMGSGPGHLWHRLRHLPHGRIVPPVNGRVLWLWGPLHLHGPYAVAKGAQKVQDSAKDKRADGHAKVQARFDNYKT
jgi:hypothetical protein